MILVERSKVIGFKKLWRFQLRYRNGKVRVKFLMFCACTSVLYNSAFLRSGPFSKILHTHCYLSNQSRCRLTHLLSALCCCLFPSWVFLVTFFFFGNFFRSSFRQSISTDSDHQHLQHSFLCSDRCLSLSLLLCVCVA